MDEVKIDEEWTQDADMVKAHYSSLTLHRKCPQAWYYRYDLGLSRDIVEVSAPERDFGSWWGAFRAAEALERGRKYDSLKGPLKRFRSVDGIEKFDAATVTVEEVFAAADDWWGKQSIEAQEDWQTRLGGTVVERLTDLRVRWLDEYEVERKNERPIAVEMFWQRELPRPPGDDAWDQASNRMRLNLLGFIDEVYYDVARGLTVARDNKTGKQLSTQSAVDDMMDSQLALYGWGATPLLKSLGVEPIRALAYDRARSAKPTTPKLTLAGRLASNVTQFDLRTYREWAAQDTRPSAEEIEEILAEKKWEPDDPRFEELRNLPPGRYFGKVGEYMATGPKKGFPKFGVYEEDPAMVEKLSTPAWRSAFLQRTLVPLSTHVVRSHLRAAVDTATDIWRTQRRTERTGEGARNLTSSNCKWCDYASLCRAQMIGGPDGEYELSEHQLKQKDGLRVISR